jgi:hypothetical protein
MCAGGLTRNLGRMFATAPTRFIASMAAAFALVAGAPAERVWQILWPQPMPTPTPRPVR